MKAVSPLMAAVILVSITVGISVLLSGSLTSVFREQSRQTEERQICTGSGIDIISIKCEQSAYDYSDPDLIGYWPLDSVNSSNYTPDLKGGKDGQLGGGDAGKSPELAAGKINSALQFDGIYDYLNVSNLPDTSQFSISLWARNTSPIYSERVLLTKGINNITYRISAMPDGRIKFMVQNAVHNFTRVDTITLNAGEDYIEPAVIDPKGEYAYFGTQTSPGKIVKVRLSDFTRVGSITLNAGENNLNSALIDPKGEYAYFGTDTSPAKVVKIRLSDFTEVATLTFNAGENCMDSPAVIDPKGEYAYFVTCSTPNKIVKIRLSDFTEVGSNNLSLNQINSAVIDPKGEYAYLGTETYPGKIVKVRLSDLAEIDNLTLNQGEDYLDSAVIDPKGEYAYFGASTDPSKIIKVRLSDLTEVDSINLTEENGIATAVIDPKGEYAYFGTFDDEPSKIVKVRLSDFTRVGSITLNTGEDWIYSSVIDPKGEFAYFGTYDEPGKIIKVKLSDFSTSEIISSSKISDSFKHITAVRDSTNISLYINGRKENTTAVAVAPSNSEELLIGSAGQRWSGFGRAGGYFSTTFPGIIDEVRIYNRSLTTSEILQHYNHHNIKLTVLNKGQVELKNITIMSRIGTNTYINATPISVKPGEARTIETSGSRGEISQIRVSAGNCPIFIEKTNEPLTIARCG